MRSLLFVPADSERKLAKAAASPADVLIADLEDAVLPERKPEARRLFRDYAQGYAGRAALWVRVNDLASGELLKDLAAVVPARPAGIVLPKIRGPEDLDVVSRYLEMAEVCHGLEPGAIRLLAVCTETPEAVLRLGELCRGHWPRLAGLMWGAEDLAAALGAGEPREADGRWRPMAVQARNQCLLAAHALGVAAIDTVFVDFRDAEGCRASAEQARYDGFTGKIAIHPDQVPIINAAFTPTEAEIAQARRVIAAFESGAGAVALDGKMLDVPHLKSARKVLRAAGLEG